MRHLRLRVLGFLTILTLAAGTGGGIGVAQVEMDTATAARALVPLLKNVRQRLKPQWRIQPGTLPPSPFSGRQSAVVAVSIGTTSIAVEDKVVRALDQLLAWNIVVAPTAPEATLFAHWLDDLKVKAAADLAAAPGATGVTCDTACVVQRFTRLAEDGRRSRKQQEDWRDELLLQALIVAVNELEP